MNKPNLEIIQLTKDLSDSEQSSFQFHYQSQHKQPTTALLLCIFLGGLGAHRFYLGKVTSGVLSILFCWTFIPEIISLVECFTIRKKVRARNVSAARAIVAKIKMTRSQGEGRVSPVSSG